MAAPAVDPGTQQPVTALLGALDAGNTNAVQVIQLCNVDLDLTGFSDIRIGENRSLIAAPGCERGLRSFGPRIFVTDKRPAGKSLFLIRNDNVRVSGFRLEGPTPEIGSGDGNDETGIRIWPLASDTPINKIVISNMVLKPQPPATVPAFYSSAGSGAWTPIGVTSP